MSGTRAFTVVGRDLVETCINDLRTLKPGVTVIDGEAPARMHNTRREAVIILYASGMVSVHEGWNVKHDDIDVLLAAKVLRGG